MEFAEYARSSAFRLDLSPRMITALFHVVHSDDPDTQMLIAPYQALERRGLITWVTSGAGKKGPVATPAGEKVAELLELANYT